MRRTLLLILLVGCGSVGCGGDDSSDAVGRVQVLAENLTRGSAIELDATHVYFSKVDMLGRVPRAGGPVDELGSIDLFSYGFVLDGDTLYIGSSERFAAFALAEGMAQTLAEISGSAYGLTLADGFLYAHSYQTESVFRTPITGGGEVFTVAEDRTSPTGTFVRGDDVFIAQGGNQGRDTAEGIISRVSLSAMGLTELATKQQYPIGLVADDTHLYWLASVKEGKIRKMPLSGGEPTTVVEVGSYPEELLLVGDHLVWTDLPRGQTGERDHRVMRVPLAGGSIETLASGQLAPWAMATDGNAVAWLTNGSSGPAGANDDAYVALWTPE